MVGRIMRGRGEGNLMSAYRDKRTDRWRYRKWIVMPDGKRRRISGTPPTDTKKAAEDAERKHIARLTNPDLANLLRERAAIVEIPTVREFSKRFMKEYLPRQKPTERYGKQRILDGQILPFFGDLRLNEV